MSLEQEPKFQKPETKESENLIDDLMKQQNFTSKIDQFYKKPETQEELVENMRILKEIPEDVSDPKVIVKLGSPGTAHKFVLMEDEDGRRYMIALPIEKKPSHRDIANFSRKLYQKDLRVIGGGYIHTDGEKLVIDGTSGDFGEAPKNTVKEILKRKFPDVDIEAFSLKDYDQKQKEENLRKILERLKTTVQKELYTDVLNKAVKLGCDYTNLPEQIAGRDDLAFMIYSSENGSSFGFDTLYLGYKDKNREIKSKAVLRERWYIRVNKVDVRDNQIYFRYRVGDEEKELTVPIDQIEKFETVDNLNDLEKQLIKTYEDNKTVFQDAQVYHGIG